MAAGIAQITVELSAKQLAHQSTRAGVVLLASFLISFVLIRTSARLMRSPRVPWWPGSVKTAGGLHVHHLVFGIVLLLLAGFVAIAVRLHSPWLELTAAGFGVGAGLTLDEYALWLHLKDVYWAEEGRRSVDAVIVAALVAGLILLGAQPLGASGKGPVLELALAIVVVLALSAGALVKGRIMLGIAGLIFPPLSLFAVVRLAQPGSPWARWRYPPDGRRMRRATARFERHTRRYRRWQDWIAGAPSGPQPSQAVRSVVGDAGDASPDGA